MIFSLVLCINIVRVCMIQLDIAINNDDSSSNNNNIVLPIMIRCIHIFIL